MLEIENPFGVVAVLTARKTGREVHPEALTDFGEPITSRKSANMFAFSLLEPCCNGKKFPREPKQWFQPSPTSS